MTSGRRGHAVHTGLRLSRSQLRRGERFRARRAVRLFASFVGNCLIEAGPGTLSSLFDALGIPTDVAQNIITLGLEQRRYGGDGLYNALNWILMMLLADVNACVTTHISIHTNDVSGVVFISDSE